MHDPAQGFGQVVRTIWFYRRGCPLGYYKWRPPPPAAVPPALGGSSSDGGGTIVGESPTVADVGSEDQKIKEKYAEIVKRTADIPPIVANQVQWTYRAMCTIKPKPPVDSDYHKAVVFYYERDTKNWSNLGHRKPSVIKAPGAADDSDSGSTHSSDQLAPGVRIPAPTRRKVPAIPRLGTPRGLDIRLRGMNIPSRAVPTSDEESGPDLTKRSRGSTGRPTPRRQQTDAEAAAAAADAQAYREDRERLAMRDAREQIKMKPYAAHTQQMATEIDRLTGNNPDLPHMIEDMHDANAELALVAAPTASSSGEGAAPTQPQLPLQGASDTV